MFILFSFDDILILINDFFKRTKTRLWLLTKAVYPRVGHVHINIAEIVRLVLVLAELERIWGIVTISHTNSNAEFLVQHKCMFIRKWGLWKTLKTKKTVTLGRPHDPKTPQRCLAFDYYYNRCNRLQSIIKSRMGRKTHWATQQNGMRVVRQVVLWVSWESQIIQNTLGKKN